MPSHTPKSATPSTAERLRDRLFRRRPTEEQNIPVALRNEIEREIERILEEKRLLNPHVTLQDPHAVSNNYTSFSTQTDVADDPVSCDCKEEADLLEYSSSSVQTDEEASTIEYASSSVQTDEEASTIEYVSSSVQTDEEVNTIEYSSSSVQTVEEAQAVAEVVDQGTQASLPPQPHNNAQHREEKETKSNPPTSISTGFSYHERIPASQSTIWPPIPHAIPSVPSTPLFHWMLIPRSAGGRSHEEVFLDNVTGELQLQRVTRLPFFPRPIYVKLPRRTVDQSALQSELCAAVLATEMPYYGVDQTSMFTELNRMPPTNKEVVDAAVQPSARIHESSQKCQSTKIPSFASPWHKMPEGSDKPGQFLVDANRLKTFSTLEGFKFTFGHVRNAPSITRVGKIPSMSGSLLLDLNSIVGD